MAHLILIRHSVPEIIPSVPASQWSLSEEGRRRCQLLADRLRPYHPDVFVTSREPKAVATGQLAADLLGLPCTSADGLQEHDRRYVSFATREQFEAAVAELFAEPERLVFGSESADQAHQRFSQAVAGVVARHPNLNVCIVTHGTVMTLFVARAAAFEPLPF